MKKVLIGLILLIESILYGMDMKEAILKDFEAVDDYTYSRAREEAEDILLFDRKYQSVFYSYDDPKRINAKRYISEIAAFYAMETIYKWDKEAIKRDNITADRFERDFMWKLERSGYIVWCIPDAHLFGTINMINEDIAVLAVNTGAPMYENGWFLFSPLYDRYYMFLENLYYSNNIELKKFIFDINHIKYIYVDK